jgi:hypothetical protein
MAAVAVRLKPHDPVCIILPSMEYLAELTAVLLAMHSLVSDAEELTRQAPDRIFVPGSRIRTLVGGYVFRVISKGSEEGVDGGAWLQPAGKKGRESNARIFFRNCDAAHFERTLSRRAISTLSSRHHAWPPNLRPRL